MFFKKKQYTGSGSLSKIAWQRFLKNELAVCAGIFIIFIVLIASLGYLITPDPTPFSNNQILEISSLKPGSQVQFLYVEKNEVPEKKSFFSKMIWGQKNSYVKVPFNSYRFVEDRIILKEFSVDTAEIDHREIEYNLADVCYAVKAESINFESNSQEIRCKRINGELMQLNVKKLQERIIEKRIDNQTFIFGTDRYGRDYLSQLIIGARVSISVGFIAVLISLFVGILFGALAGFFRSWVDNFIVWFINIVWSIPTLLLVIAITFALGKGFWQIFIAVGLTMWVEVARIVRGQIFSIREKEFVEAGKALAFSNFRIIFNHILPNIMGPVIVISAANFASAILIEAGLSFLGIGVQPPMPSWGSMIKENYAYIILDSAYLAVLPGVAIMLLVLAFMIIGNALRDALDMKTSLAKE